MTLWKADIASPVLARLTLARLALLDYVGISFREMPNMVVSEIQKPLAAANG